MSVAVTGVAQVLRAHGKAVKQDAVKVAVGLQLCAEVIKELADYYCPVLTGAMLSTGAINTEGVGLGARTYVSYGGETAPYTLYVHENLESYHTAPTCAQWLARATKESRQQCRTILSRTFTATSVKAIDNEVVD